MWHYLTILVITVLPASAAYAQSDYVISLSTKKSAQQSESSRSPFTSPLTGKGASNYTQESAQRQPQLSPKPVSAAPVAVLGRQQMAQLEQTTPLDPIEIAPDAGTGRDILFLVCVGEGRANQLRSASHSGSVSGSMSGTNSNGNFSSGSFHGSSSGTSFWMDSVPFDEQVNVEITKDVARIRMPRAMLPIIRGGVNGWMKINNLQWGENEIIGSVGVNVINNPKLRIDRLTGALSVNGKAGDFVAICQSIDPNRVRRRF